MEDPKPEPKRRISKNKTVLIIFVFLVAGITLFAIKQYFMSPYLSYKDFATVQKRMDQVAGAMNLTNVDKEKYCSYNDLSSNERTTDYRLGCSVTLSTQIPVTSRQEFEELAKRFETHSQAMQAHRPIVMGDWRGKDYYHKRDGFMVAGAGHHMSCHVEVRGGDGEEVLSTHSSLDRATVRLGCDGLSKEPYFEMR